MAKRNSTRSPLAGKPAKPYPDFPLTPHPSGRWCKKIRGRLVYFGRWEDPDGALQCYLDQKNDLHAGRVTQDEQALTVYGLCGRFLTVKKNLVENRELSPHTLELYAATCKLLIKRFGRNRPVSTVGPTDFEGYRTAIAKRWGLHRLCNEVTRVRSIFRYAVENGLVEKPILFGQSFKPPSRKAMRKHRAEQGPKMFDADEIRKLLDAGGQPLKTMILLGINCGFGNSDVGTLPLAALDLERAWINHARPKTGIERRCPLWPETVAALKDWLAIRPAPTNESDAGLVFITAYGGSWAKTGPDSPVSKEMRKLLDKLKINGKRNFYALRHTFQTIGDEARDFVGVRKIMGHAMDEDIANVYRERVSDERLRAVVEHVRGWLFGVSDAGRQPFQTP